MSLRSMIISLVELFIDPLIHLCKTRLKSIMYVMHDLMSIFYSDSYILQLYCEYLHCISLL